MFFMMDKEGGLNACPSSSFRVEAEQITMLASRDILAIDQACVDLVYNFGDSRKDDLIERIESREGLRQLSAMKDLGMGSDQYELISLD